VTLYIKNVTGALYTVYNENTLSVSVSVNAAWNSVVLTARRNDCCEVAALTDKGRAFQAVFRDNPCPRHETDIKPPLLPLHTGIPVRASRLA